MLVLSRAELEALLPPLDVIDALETGFRLYAEGLAHVPPRTVVPAGQDGTLLLMPATSTGVAGGAALGTKLVTLFAGNRARGHPTIYGSYVLMDGATGRPLALLEATLLTALRTGATSALAARYLARPNARSVTCFGAGVQAGFQLFCLAAVRRLDRITVVGRDPARVHQFAERVRARLDVPVTVAADARTAVRDADIIACATTSSTPVVHGADLAPGTHLDLVGAFRPSDREADTEALRRARVVVDTYEGALAEAGDVLIPLKEGAFPRDHVAAELAELVTGARPGRTSESEITVFKSVGWALEDLAAARLAYNRARMEGVGTEVSL